MSNERDILGEVFGAENLAILCRLEPPDAVLADDNNVTRVSEVPRFGEGGVPVQTIRPWDATAVEHPAIGVHAVGSFLGTLWGDQALL